MPRQLDGRHLGDAQPGVERVDRDLCLDLETAAGQGEVGEPRAPEGEVPVAEVGELTS